MVTSGQKILLLIAVENVNVWRQAWTQAVEQHDRRSARVAAEELEFWTNKSAMLRAIVQVEA